MRHWSAGGRMEVPFGAEEAGRNLPLEVGWRIAVLFGTREVWRNPPLEVGRLDSSASRGGEAEESTLLGRPAGWLEYLSQGRRRGIHPWRSAIGMAVQVATEETRRIPSGGRLAG